MTTAVALPSYSLGEEIANAVTHGVDIVLAIAGLAALSVFAALHGNAAHVAGSAMFGAALVACYTTSTLYHAIPLQRARQLLRAIDHSTIFLLIAGTYTPFMLVSLGGALGWTMLAVIWTLAAAGIAARLLLAGRRDNLVVVCYVAMGWIVVFVAKPLVASLPAGGLALFAAGGLAYTLGVIFYKWRSLPYHHAVWHGFVLAGSALHFFAVLLYVVPGPAA
jgi:hemolysin III